MPWSFTVGNVAGTAIRIHVTFFLLLAWIGISAGMRGGSEAALANIIFIMLLFLCVLLHEFGHILMARHFGIPTPEVTLLPIGGVASLERMPDRPKEQLLVALAGPAVNVVIALLLVIALGVSLDASSMTSNLVSLDDPRHGLLSRLAAANIFLVVFNMIPAFPMDGGRVLNAILAMNMDKRKAVRISARIGQGLALVFGFLGLFGNPMLLFIAIFVYMGAAGEAAQTELESMTSTLDVRDAMESEFVALPLEATLDDAVKSLLSTAQHEFPLVDHFGKPMGLLTRDALIGALRDKRPDSPVMEIAQSPVPSVRAQDKLDFGLKEMNRIGAPAISVVDAEGRVCGLLTMQNVGEMMMIRAAQPEWTFRTAQGRG